MRILLLLLLSNFAYSAFAQSFIFGKQSKIYLVRHAEKLPGNDPLLTSDGNKRAGDLMRTLKQKHIKRIYVTEFRRTQNTADSLRIQMGIDTVHYLADTTSNDLVNKLKVNKDVNQAILIIGHSNTLPAIIRKLGVTDYPLDEIPSNEFDNLFLLENKKGKPILTIVKFGAKSGVSDTMK